MADPTIQSFCCHHKNNSHSAYRLMNEFNKDSYLIISLISSVVGIIGSFYQIFVRKNDQEANTTRSLTGRRIIICLAYADLFASCGIFVRTALWTFFKRIMPFDDDNSSVIFCSISSAFIQTFYTATWLFTFVYAYNMKKALKNQTISILNVNYIVWCMSVLFTAIGTTTLYYPDADCHDIHDMKTALFRVMPNYLLNYGPILFVMIINPIIYIQCSKEVDRQLILRYGQYTNNERNIHDLFKIKFSLINIIFYICWLPNIANAILMWTMWSMLSRRNIIGLIVVINWYIIAIFNPLQAFFNALVYRKWNDKLIGCCSVKSWLSKKFQKLQNGTYTTQIITDTMSFNATESTPLLQQTHVLMTSDDELEQDNDNELQIREHQNFHKFSIQCSLV
ncbi:hypothetical protein PVAND_014268 [Polypedilum vanderplanki]|uniref:Uncharacterized protein n=1 Tax=Polypedilum vanderplanki TaxID=319348 RepID=A0A9J6CTL6_POLVA|nr:hypothetical protein PVAND_014268 [Polypedilum vanderplanki]